MQESYLSSTDAKYHTQEVVIGEIVVGREDYFDLSESYVCANDFYLQSHKEIYRAFKKILAEGNKIDTTTLRRELKEDTFAAAIQAAGTSVHMVENDFVYHLKLMRDDVKEMNTLNVLRDICSGGYEDIESMRDRLTDAITCLDNIGDRTGIELKEAYVEYMATAGNPKDYLETGMRKLDKHLMIESGDMIVFGGKPSAGKTAFTLQLMLNIAKKKRVVYYSLETKEMKLFQRALSNRTGLPLNLVKDFKDVSENQNKLFQDGYIDFSDMNGRLINASGWTISKVFASAKREKADVIFVDYIGILSGDGKSSYEKMTQISNDLHIMCQRTGITAFALSQLNRAGHDQPDMSSLRDSGAIEQDADAIMLLYAPEGRNEEPSRTLDIVKNKEGSIGTIHLDFDGRTQQFREVDYRYE